MKNEKLPHVQRMCDELEQLSTRTAALTAFIGTPTFAEIDSQSSGLLVSQLDFMRMYERVLIDRIDCIECGNHFSSTKPVQMPFGSAVLAMRAGKRVARVGWNGSGMFAYLVPAASYPAQTGVAKAYFGDGAMVPYREYLALKTAQGDVATWSPSGSDALAEDWVVLA